MDKSNIKQLIEAEQTRSQYQNLPFALIGSVVTAMIVASPFVGVLPGWRVGGWLAVALLSSFVRLLWGPLAYRRAGTGQDDTRRWLRRAVLGAFMGGCAWGSAGVMLFMPDSMPHQAWLTLMLVGMSAASLNAYAAFLPVYLSYLLPSLIPLVTVQLHHDSAFSLGQGIVILLFIGLTMRFAIAFNRTIVNSLRLQFENLDLVAKLRIQMEAAQAANLAKSRFLAAASHDLRQPMHAMSLYLSTLERQDLNEAARTLVGNLHGCADAMHGLFNALLDISRLDANTITPVPTDFPVNQLLDRMRLEYAPRAQERGLALRVRPTSLSVRSDPVLVERILRNLVANAVRHTRQGKLLIGCRRRGDRVRLLVYDTGPGIAVEHQQHIFEEFYQIGNPERDRSKGLGLGLAIVDRLVRLLGLTLDFRSVPGRGTCFAVNLPRAAVVRAEPRTMTPGDISELVGRLIIVVDDETAILDATRTLLESWRCEVITAASGAEALAKLATAARVPDLLLSDYRLRDNENGINVIVTLRNEFNTDIPAILISGDTGPERLREAQASGIALLHKPLDAEQLCAAVSSLLAAAHREFSLSRAATRNAARPEPPGFG
jgi:signal transduction histidine kinase/CheY-like chemotaxis protein